MTGLFIILGAAVAGVAALTDLHHFKWLAFLEQTQWLRRRALICILGIVTSAAAGIHADRQTEAREKERDARERERDAMAHRLATANAKIADQQTQILAHSRLTADQQQKIIEILESPRYRHLPRERAFREFYLDLVEKVGIEARAAKELATQAQREYQYRPLDSALRASVLERLRPVAHEAKRRGLKVSIYVRAHSEDDNRTRVVRDIAALMRDAGLDTLVEAVQIIVGQPAGSPAAICFHPEHESVARGLLAALEPMVKSPWVGVRNEASDKCPQDTLRLQIVAIPRFNYRDGTVELR